MEQDLFLGLKEQLDADLEETGFRVQRRKLIEPRVPTPIRTQSRDSLKDVYDQLLTYYDYLTDLIVGDTRGLAVAKGRKDDVLALASARVYNEKAHKNAGARQAAVDSDGEVRLAKRDLTYFTTRVKSHTERRDKIKRWMDRVGRELWLRTQDGVDEPQINAPTFGDSFKRKAG